MLRVVVAAIGTRTGLGGYVDKIELYIAQCTMGVAKYSMRTALVYSRVRSDAAAAALDLGWSLLLYVFSSRY